MIVGLMRVKNEARWISEAVSELRRLADAVLVLDDHSEDNTVDLALRAGAHVITSPFDGIDEARDKDFLVEQAWKRYGPFAGNDWAIMLDGDEVLMDHWEMLECMSRVSEEGRPVALAPSILYLWDSPEMVRIDGIYGSFYRQSAWPIGASGGVETFRRTKYGNGANFHCSSVPDAFTRHFQRIPVRVKHYGYMHRDDRIRKFHWYNTIDPLNDFDDRYRHMVIGDLFPPTSRFRWAGPLKKVPLRDFRPAPATGDILKLRGRPHGSDS